MHYGLSGLAASEGKGDATQRNIAHKTITLSNVLVDHLTAWA